MMTREQILKQMEKPLIPLIVAAGYMACSRNRFEERYGKLIQPAELRGRKKMYLSEDVRNLPLLIKQAAPVHKKKKFVPQLNVEAIFRECYAAAGLSKERIEKAMMSFR